jgi:hypothetical protein
LEKSAHYTLHSKTTPFWACPKRRRFAQNGVVLAISDFSFFFLFFSKRKKKKGNRGWLWPPHTAGMGWPKPPPGLWGWSGHPEKPPRKKKKKRNGFVPLGGGLGVVVGGGRSHPRPLGVVRPPPTAQTHFVFFFFFFLVAFRGGRSHPQAFGGGFGPPYQPYGVAEATPWPKMGWSSHLFFDFPFFFFPSFLKKKKKKLKSEMGQNYAVLGEPKTA